MTAQTLTTYRRTRIRRIQATGYRSLVDLDVSDIPDLVVLHGPNGVGKSNLLRVPSLLLRWASLGEGLMWEGESERRFSKLEAHELLGIRESDFTFGREPRMKLAVEIELGARVDEALAIGQDERVGKVLYLEATARLRGDGMFEVFFQRADVDGSSQLRSFDWVPAKRSEIFGAKNQLSVLEGEIRTVQAQLESQGFRDVDRPSYNARREKSQKLRDETAQRLASLVREVELQERYSDRLRIHILRSRLLHHTPPYRDLSKTQQSDESATAPLVADNIPRLLFDAKTSANSMARKGFRDLERELRESKLLGDLHELLTIKDTEFNEYQLLVARADGTEIPVHQLGTGQQQAMAVLAELFLSGCPIVGIEEPEAHLHRETMSRLGDYLSDVVKPKTDGRPALDQLWITTHAHAFAIAPEYLDVSMVDGRTVVEKKPRAKAAVHFYEPGPLWDVLRHLVDQGYPSDAIIFRDEEGKPVRAGELLASIEGSDNQQLANQYAKVATEAIVRAMAAKARRTDGEGS